MPANDSDASNTSNDDVDRLQEKIEDAGRDRKEARDAMVSTGSHVAVAVATTVGGATLGPVGAIIAGGLTTMGLEAWLRLTSLHAQKRAYRFLAAINELIDEGNVPPEGSPESEAFEEVLFHSYRHLMSAIDDAVIPALSRLTAEYRDGRKPDKYFRSVGGFLEKLDEGGLQDAKTLTNRLFDVVGGILEPPGPNETAVHFEPTYGPDRKAVLTVAWPKNWTFGNRTQIEEEGLPVTGWQEIAEMLEREGLVHRTEPAMVYNPPPMAFIIEYDMLRRIRDLLCG